MSRLTGCGERTVLPAVSHHLHIELAKLLEQSGEHLARERRQSVLGIFEDPRQLMPQPCHASTPPARTRQTALGFAI
jgi:hypothetical protein